MTKKEITDIVMKGASGEYSHCVIYCDHWDYSYNYRYVGYDESINSVINSIKACGSLGMYSIKEVYNYNLALKSQINERRAYHIEPAGKPKKVIESEENSAENQNVTIEHSNISENLKKAIDYATKMHAGQTRLNGEPYIHHPLHVLELVLKFKRSRNIETLLISACLHDTLEDTKATYYEIVQLFGPQVASLVLELTTNEDIKNALGKQEYLSLKMKNMSSWALVIKLCDRLSNVSDLLNCPSDLFRNKYISETMGILDYLLKNAKLSNTHLTIIEQILYLLLQLTKGDNEKAIKLAEIQKNLSMLKAGFQKKNEDIFNELMKHANCLDRNIVFRPIN